MNTQVQCSLATERQENAVGALFLDNIGDVFRGDREVVDFVGEDVGSLDGSDVGVDKDGLDASFFQSLERLRTRVIELSGLSDGETTRANDENLLDIDEVLRTSDGTALKVCFRIGSGLGLVGRQPSRPGEASDVVGSSLGLPLLPDASWGLGAKGAAGNARSCLASLVEELLLQLAGQLAAKSHGCVFLSVVLIGLWCGQSSS